MSVPLPITPSELRKAQRLLRKDQTIICCDTYTHVMLLAVGLEMLKDGQDVKAKIVKANITDRFTE